MTSIKPVISDIFKEFNIPDIFILDIHQLYYSNNYSVTKKSIFLGRIVLQDITYIIDDIPYFVSAGTFLFHTSSLMVFKDKESPEIIFNFTLNGYVENNTNIMKVDLGDYHLYNLLK